MNDHLSDSFTREVDLTRDVGATVSVPSWARESVRLNAGGDLSISIVMPASAAREFGLALIAAADATTP